MLVKKSQMEIKVLHRQGKGIREIARQTGLSRNTVRAVLRGAHDDVYGPRASRPTTLGPYEQFLRERLSAAGDRGLAATVLMREIQERGYDGGISQLKLYLAKIRPPQVVEPIIRFETMPADQLQIDFVVFRRGEHPVRAFTATLGHSHVICGIYRQRTPRNLGVLFRERTNNVGRCYHGSTPAIHLFHGDKGGVGKSFAAAAFGEYLLGKGQPIMVVESDTRNADAARYFDGAASVKRIDLRRTDGWVEFLTLLNREPNDDILVSLPSAHRAFAE